MIFSIQLVNMPHTHKGNKRKGARHGARLAYDDTKADHKGPAKSTMMRRTTRKGNARKTAPNVIMCLKSGRSSSSSARCALCRLRLRPVDAINELASVVWRSHAHRYHRHWTYVR